MTAPSQFPPVDDLDRLIEDTARDMVAGEPKRVSAASVREAIAAAPPPRSILPVWLSLAAVLLVGFLVVWKRAPDQAPSLDTVAPRPLAAAQRVVSPSPAGVVKSRAPQEVAGVSHATGRPRRAGVELLAIYEPHEGFPRLMIAAIERPQPLATSVLVDQRLEISRIDIEPLRLSALDHEQH